MLITASNFITIFAFLPTVSASTKNNNDQDELRRDQELFCRPHPDFESYRMERNSSLLLRADDDVGSPITSQVIDYDRDIGAMDVIVSAGFEPSNQASSNEQLFFESCIQITSTGESFCSGRERYNDWIGRIHYVDLQKQTPLLKGGDAVNVKSTCYNEGQVSSQSAYCSVTLHYIFLPCTHCSLSDRDDPTEEEVLLMIGYTNNVTRCGATHGWITPDNIMQDNTNVTAASPVTLVDRVEVLSNRVLLIVEGLRNTFAQGTIIDTLVTGILSERTKLIDSCFTSFVLEAAAALERLLSLEGQCPSPPIYRWQKACSNSQSCSSSLQIGLSSSWTESTYHEFATGVTMTRDESYGTTASSGSDTTTGSDSTVSDSYSFSSSATSSTTVGVEAGFPFGSASVETGLEVSAGSETGGETSNTQFSEQTQTSSNTASVDLSSGIARDTSRSMGGEMSRTAGVTVTRSCDAQCEIDDPDHQVELWQWVSEQFDPNGQTATVYTCFFVCRSAIHDGPPLCPGQRCLNDDCTVCKPGTFSNPEMDAFFSTPRGTTTPSLSTRSSPTYWTTWMLLISVSFLARSR